jgi:hypothetical protein
MKDKRWHAHVRKKVAGEGHEEEEQQEQGRCRA